MFCSGHKTEVNNTASHYLQPDAHAHMQGTMRMRKKMTWLQAVMKTYNRTFALLCLLTTLLCSLPVQGDSDPGNSDGEILLL